MQSKENIYPLHQETQKIRVKNDSHVAQPLRDVNYRHQQRQGNQSMMKKIIPTVTGDEVNQGDSVKGPREMKPKQKISLTEYRARAKSKSPNKNPVGRDGDALRESTEASQLGKEVKSVTGAAGGKTVPSLDEKQIDVDFANLSITETETEYLDDTTGHLVKADATDKVKVVTSDRLKLKKSSSSTSCGKNKPVDETRGSKSYSSLPGIRVTQEPFGSEDRNSVVAHSREDSSNDSKKSEKVSSPDMIDLTEDEESPAPSDKSRSESSKSSSTSQSSRSEGFEKVSPVLSFKALNQQPIKQQEPNSQSQQWTQMRDQSSLKGHQTQMQEDAQIDTERLKQSLQMNIQKRNELARVLEKQKVLVSKVKMSDLPDKGAKLRGAIERLTSELQQVNTAINNNLAKLNSSVKASGGQSGSATKGSEVVQVHPDKTHSVPTGPQVIRVHPDGTKTMVSAGAQLPSGVRIVKVHPGSAGNQPGLHQPHNPDNLKQTSLLPHVAQIPPHILQQMYAANPQAMQLYGGRMTAARLREVGSVTKEAIERLHKQLETIPSPGTEVDDPTGVNVPLMTHQRQALAWLVWREQQSPSGGILADDMGLGKTLTMIALILKQREVRTGGSKEEKAVWLNRDKQLEKLGKTVVKSNATLVVCPASLIHQWRTEIERRCEPGLLRVCMYHGPNRERNILKLAGYDVVLTTYNIVSKEVVLDDKDKNGETPVKDEANDEEKDNETEEESAKPVEQTNMMRIAWERIVLDEGHTIKNHKSQQSRAVSRLRAGFRWVLTGTPIQNDLLDMYAQLRFLRCSPFDEYKVWKKQVDSGSRTGESRLNVLVKTLLLRRTKSQTSTVTGKPLVALPDKSVTTHELKLSDQEQHVYDRVFDQSRSALKEYLKRHEDKEHPHGGSQTDTNPFTNKISDTGALVSASGGAQIGLNMGASKSGTMKAQHILVMLLRLRQCCCHLSLMKDALDDETQENEGVELSLEEQLMDLALSDSGPRQEPADPESGTSIKSKEPPLSKSSLIFQPEAVSTKMQALLEELQKIHRPKDSTERSKSVIVSQWTKMLDIVQVHATKMGLKCSVIRGDIPAKKRMESVDLFNNDPKGPEVMLVSLRAGGCGLNLIGGNHLFLLDSHWNPALEDQACDRIYRMGQKKNVFIHRFLCKETVEEKIIALQKKKQTLADSILTGSAAAKTKLSLNDLRMLFNV